MQYHAVKRLNKSEEKVLQFQECETQKKKLKEENKALLDI